MTYQPRLFRRGSMMVFEDIELIDIEKVPGLYPSAQGRLVQLLDDLDEAWSNKTVPTDDEPEDDDYET